MSKEIFELVFENKINKEYYNTTIKQLLNSERSGDRYYGLMGLYLVYDKNIINKDEYKENIKELLKKENSREILKAIKNVNNKFDLNLEITLPEVCPIGYFKTRDLYNDSKLIKLPDNKAYRKITCLLYGVSKSDIEEVYDLKDELDDLYSNGWFIYWKDGIITAYNDQPWDIERNYILKCKAKHDLESNDNYNNMEEFLNMYYH